MSIELLIGVVVVIAIVVFFLMKDTKEVATDEPTLVADKVEAAKVEEVKAAPAPKAVKAAAPAKKTTKKTAPKKAEKVDLDSLNKTQLLEEAKKRGVKANASLKKEEILERIKNG